MYAPSSGCRYGDIPSAALQLKVFFRTCMGLRLSRGLPVALSMRGLLLGCGLSCGGALDTGDMDLGGDMDEVDDASPGGRICELCATGADARTACNPSQPSSRRVVFTAVRAGG